MSEHKTLRLAAVASVVFAALSAGCGDSGTGPIRIQVRVFANPPSIPVNGTTTIIAEVTTDLAQPGPGAAIEWSTNLGALMSSGGSVTDSTGRTTATLRGTGETGVAVVTAAIVRTAERGQVAVRIGLD